MVAPTYNDFDAALSSTRYDTLYDLKKKVPRQRDRPLSSFSVHRVYAEWANQLCPPSCCASRTYRASEGAVPTYSTSMLGQTEANIAPGLRGGCGTAGNSSYSTRPTHCCPTADKPHRNLEVAQVNRRHPDMDGKPPDAIRPPTSTFWTVSDPQRCSGPLPHYMVVSQAITS